MKPIHLVWGLIFAVAISFCPASSSAEPKDVSIDQLIAESLDLWNYRYQVAEADYQMSMGRSLRPPFQESSDGRYVLIYAIRSNIRSTAIDVRMTVFEIEAVRRAIVNRQERIAPRAEINIVTKSEHIVPRWDGINSAIIYNEGDDRQQRWHRWNFIAGKIDALATTPGVNVIINGDGGIWTGEPSDVTGLMDAYVENLYPREMSSTSRMVQARHYPMWEISTSFPAPVLRETRLYFKGKNTGTIEERCSFMWLAPDGRAAILIGEDAAAAVSRAGFPKDAGAPVYLANLVTGEFHVVARRMSAQEGEPCVQWSGDSRRVVVANVPIVSKGQHFSSWVFDTTDSSLHVVLGASPSAPSNSSIVGIEWHAFGGSFDVIEARSDSPPRRRNIEWTDRGLWEERASVVTNPPSKPADRPVIKFRQSMSKAPEVVAEWKGGQTQLIPGDALPPTFVHAEPFVWTENGSEKVKGLLLLPRNQVASAKLPLVVQIQHWVDESVFAPNGSSSDGYAAQVFANCGIAVAMIPMTESKPSPKITEYEIVARLESMVSELATRGIVDPRRVGVIGHSRCGYQTLYAVTHSRNFRPAAAAIMDAVSGSFAEVLESPYSALHMGDFWSDTSAWLNHDPIFNAHRIPCPLLFIENTNMPYSGLATGMSNLRALNAAGIPVEAFWFPHAGHNPALPFERMENMKAVVEWMRFWLQDIAPGDHGRAKTWGRLRIQQQALQKRPLPPEGKWIFAPSAPAERDRSVNDKDPATPVTAINATLYSPV